MEYDCREFPDGHGGAGLVLDHVEARDVQCPLLRKADQNLNLTDSWSSRAS